MGLSAVAPRGTRCRRDRLQLRALTVLFLGGAFWGPLTRAFLGQVPAAGLRPNARGKAVLQSRPPPRGSVSAAAGSEYAAAVEAAAASAPAIAGVIGVAALSSVSQLSRDFVIDAPSVGGDAFFGSQRWAGRTAIVALLWLVFVSYTLLLAPGTSPEAKAADLTLIQQILSTPFDGSVPPLFVCIFNMLGIWPAIYAATLLPGAARQSPVPAWPFVGGSFFLGAFALAPYIALREYRGSPGPTEEVDWLTKNLLESRLNALLLLAGAAYLASYALGNGSIGAFAPSEAWASFLPLFMAQSLPHVSCIDFMVLWMLYSPVLLEDGRRRGCFQGPPSTWSGADTARFAIGAGVPVLGGVSWLLTRPALPAEGESA